MKPFLKWAGGKTHLLQDIDITIRKLGIDVSKPFDYVEPFVGGGSVLFHMLERYPLRRVYLHDLNVNLYNCYHVVASDYYPRLKEILSRIENKFNNAGDNQAVYYADIRRKLNEWEYDNVERAAAFIFLNKTCFNGLWRENKSGGFNVPWNKVKHVKLFDEKNLDACHNALKNISMSCGDFTLTEMYSWEPETTLYYLDPPYRPISTTSSFTTYTKVDFNDEDQVRLKEFCDTVTANPNAHVIVSNSNCGEYFNNLYQGYNIDVVNMRRSINSQGGKRGKIEEILIYK